MITKMKNNNNNFKLGTDNNGNTLFQKQMD